MENKEKLEELASNLAIKSVKEYMKIFPSCDNTFDYRRGFEEGFIEGVKYQAERMYNGKAPEILEMLKKVVKYYHIYESDILDEAKQLIKESTYVDM
jgi:hypothetical protein